MSAGASSAARAAALRRAARGGPWRRLLAVLGLDRRGAAARALAARCDAGAVGEGRTADLLAALKPEGWYEFYDRRLPGGGRANADHVLIPPCGSFAVNVDSKLWSARAWVHPGPGWGQLWHGREDRSGALRAIEYETREIGRALGVPVVTLICVHNAPVSSGGFSAGDARVVPAGQLLTVLRSMPAGADPARAARLAARAARMLPRYVQEE